MKTFKQGLHLLEKKELSEEKKIRRIAPPSRVILPLSQHTGAPCEALVKKGDVVKEGEKIADSSSFVSSPIHASISGKVSSIEKMPHPLGGEITSIIIERENNDERKVWDKVAVPFMAQLSDESDRYKNEREDADESTEENKARSEVDISSLEPTEIRSKIREAGIVGLGGAAFPTHVKLSPPEDKPIEAVILNGCECEPYLTSDHRLMLERADDCIYGLKVIMKALGAKSGYVGIENNKPGAIALFREKLKGEDNIEVVSLKTKYPQGGEKMLIKAILNREVPSLVSNGTTSRTGLPLDVGVVVNNVGTAVAITEAIKWDKPLLERVVTVTGSAVKNPSNLLVPLGTSFSHLIDECGGLRKKASKIIMGGPMMGISQYILEVPVIKGTSGILILTRKEILFKEEGPCIKCSQCIDHCPMGLLPTTLARLVKREMWDSLKDYNIMDCIECGCCTYVCPSKIPLVHYIKLGKLQVQKQATSKA
ncbi:electron transport complex subunit RsxC [Candidatus Aerophobetes bacterium]|nr:electron transport complex subunit RsxC [Candidatus Aerophobetes bacterium]